MIKDLFCGKDRDVILGKVNPGFEQSDQLHQFLLDGLEPARECAVKLLGGDLGLIEGLRFDQIADSFSLGKIDAAIEKGAHGEFTWLGEPCAMRQRQFDDVAQHNGRAVGRNFDDVVGRVGMRRGKVSDNNFVDALVLTVGVWSGRPRPLILFFCLCAAAGLVAVWHDRTARTARLRTAIVGVVVIGLAALALAMTTGNDSNETSKPVPYKVSD